MAPRGRKKGSNGETSRTLLLQIAADEFAEHGYHETKISTIVRKANVTQPTFYLYFKSKEAIFEELEALFRGKLVSLTMNSLLGEGLDTTILPDRIAEGLTAIFQFFSEHRSLARIGFYVSPSAANVKAQMAAQFESNLCEEVAAGYFHPNADMAIVANALVGMIDRLAITKLWTGEKTAQELAKEIVTLLLHGLKKEIRIQ